MYTWGPGLNPAWNSSNLTNSTLGWQASINTVSTSGFNAGTGNWYTYNNSQITTYTSPLVPLTGCPTSSYLIVNLSLEINLENRYDWLYFQYSNDGGTTWVNPVAQSASTNASGVNLSGYSPLTTYANINSNRNGWTGNLGVINPSYTIPNTANRFRYIFASDPSVNSYTIGFTTYVYYADLLNFTVICPIFLPVELKSFEAYNISKGLNEAIWSVENEINSDYYLVERSENGIDWVKVEKTSSTGSSNYLIRDQSFNPVINYYRLSQFDTDGSRATYNELIVSVDNRLDKKEIISIHNLLGQPVHINTPGVIIIQYKDGSTERKLN
jgi:hypothetical protein